MPMPSKVFTARHFQGMKYVTDTSDWDHSYVYRARNMVPINGTYVFRPGDDSWSLQPAGQKIPQCEIVFRRSDGNVYDTLVVAGEIYYRQDAGAGSLILGPVVTQATLTAATITLST